MAYSVSGITLSDPTFVCPGLLRRMVRVFPPGDEERFMDQAKLPPPGLGPGNKACMCGGGNNPGL